MLELPEIIDEYAGDPLTLHTLRRDIARWLDWLHMTTRCHCGCGENVSLNIACRVIWRWARYHSSIAEDDWDGMATAVIEQIEALALRHRWPSFLRGILTDWHDLFEETYPEAHPVIQQGFGLTLDLMMISDFMSDQRAEVEAQLARRERQAADAVQPELFPA